MLTYFIWIVCLSVWATVMVVVAFLSKRERGPRC